VIGPSLVFALAFGCSRGGWPLARDLPAPGDTGAERDPWWTAGHVALPGPVVDVLGVTAHTVDLGLDAWAGATVRVTCRGGGDEHTRDTVAQAGEAIRFRGLLAAQDYRCSVVSDGGRMTTVDATTAVEEHPLPPVTVTGEPVEIDDSYVLFNVFVDGLESNEQQVVITDAEGRLRWSTWLGDDAKGDVDSSWLGDDTVMYGGGYGVYPTQLSLDGEQLWQAPRAPTSHSYHHQAREAADGSVITLTLTDDVYEGTDYHGHWVGDWTMDGELAWSWTTAQAVEQGALVPNFEDSDLFHANAAVEVDWPGCDLLVSLRDVDALVCVDRTSGDVAWILQQDFTLVDEAGDAIADDWPEGQHDPEPDGNKLLVFDNGPDREGDVQTRVIEYELDPSALTAQILWSYAEEGWDEVVWGGVERFGDDRVLIAFPHCSNGDPEDPARTAIIGLDGDHEQAWRMQFDEETVGIYRASLIDPCAIFENRRYCPG